MIDWIISITSVLSIYFLGKKQKIGLWIGLLSQPLWFYWIYKTGSYGLQISNMAYTIIYVKSLWYWKD